MAKVIINRRHKTYQILAQSTVGPARNYFYLTSTVVSGASSAATLTFQATLIRSKELVRLQALQDANAPLTDEEIALLSQYHWDQAPDWANYAAMNEDGSANWFANEPVRDESRGRWVFKYGDRRSWPMHSTVRLFRCWRDSLRQRPSGNDTSVTPDAPATCLCYGDTIVTDAIGYIEATLGNIQVLPQCTWPNCACGPDVVTPPPTPTQPLGAKIVIEVSNDGLAWLELGNVTLSETEATDGFSSQASWAYVRARLETITGQDAFVTVTMGV